MQPTQSYSFQGGGGIFFGSALHSRGREDCVWCRARWSALSEVAALDAPSLGMLWKHNGSWLRVQARLSRIYIYIKAANPPELHCSRGETHSELLCSRLHDQTLVSLLFRSVLCCSLHWNARSKMLWRFLGGSFHRKMWFLRCLKCQKDAVRWFGWDFTDLSAALMVF